MTLKPLYTFLKYYVPIGFRVYFRRFRVQGQQYVPKSGPVIFAPNHQNAFMDAMAVAISSSRRPWFMTRASIFKSPIARFWLGSLKMMPIFRIRDGIDQVKRNDAAIARCSELLLRGQPILIFPEGDHDHKWTLRKFQKGLARIAFNTLETDSECGLTIVPVGLQYENHKAFGSDLLVSFGPPIHASDYLSAYQQEPPKAIDQLMAETRKRIEKLMVNIQPEEQYDEIKAKILDSPRETDLALRLRNDQKIAGGENNIPIKSERRKDYGHIFKVAGFPVYVYALLNNILPILTIKWIMRRFIRDHHWVSSIRFTGMLLITPLFWVPQSVMFYQFTGDWLLLLAYMASLPLSVYVASRYWWKYSWARF